MTTSRRDAPPDDGPPGPRLYSPAEIAKALGCSEWWVKEQARRRRIPYSWIGGSYKFTAEQLAEIIHASEVRPQPTAPQSAAGERRPRRRLAAPALPTAQLRARPQPQRRGGSDTSAA
jgi:hypothetical protein